ncbi:MAG: UDP-N-acetylmuramoyl-L-alanyl-D-glutamate--2,6-diaminopimelate ligase [Bdellovibrionota bacterium]
MSFTIPQPFISIKEIVKTCAEDEIYSLKLPIYFHSSYIEELLKTNSTTPRFIYIARKGQKFDGNNLAKKILNSGNFFIGEMESIQKIYASEAQKLFENKLFISVKSTEQTLNMALEKSFKIQTENFFTIAVTGTNGKTSVTQITANLLQELYKENILKIGTLGVQFGNIILPVSHVTTPDYPAFLNILATAQENNVKKIILEYTSHGLQENRLGKWPIDIAIFTNLTQDHLDYHKTMANYRSAKQLLFSQCLTKNGTAIININNNEWEHFINAALGKNRNLIAVGNSKLHAEIKTRYGENFNSITFVYIENTISNLNGISGKLVVQNLQRIEHQFSCLLIGEFQFENILCAAGVGIALKFSLEQICGAVSKIQNIPGRLEKIDASQKLLPTVLVDYAHTPDALEKSIQTCKKTLSPNGKLITVFGCGGDRDASKRPLMGKIAFEQSHFVVVTSDNPRTEDPNKIIDDIFGDAHETEKHMRECDRRKAIEKAILLASKNDVILVAGKGHEDYQIIGTTKYPFSDADVVKSILEKL